MKYLILALLLTGCQDGALVLTEEARAKVKKQTQVRGDTRLQLFKECMQFAAQIPRKGDDDVSDIIDSCSSESRNMASHKEAE